jgi:addiction module HigA family antidote
MATKISFQDGMPAIHPGEFLKEIVDELGLSQVALAQALGISTMRVSHVLKGSRPVTAELALRLGRVMDQTPQYWLNLQASYDLKLAQIANQDSLSELRRLAA